ncbi:MAG: hypothetical protein ACP5NV_00480 [Candidatus Woesearchaeota archaeon]
MELGDFLERDIIHFLEQKREKKQTMLIDREEDYGIYLTKDYLKEVSRLLDKDELTGAQRLFEELREKYFELPKDTLESKNVYAILEQMYAKIDAYVKLRGNAQSIMPFSDIISPGYNAAGAHDGMMRVTKIEKKIDKIDQKITTFGQDVHELKNSLFDSKKNGLGITNNYSIAELKAQNAKMPDASIRDANIQNANAMPDIHPKSASFEPNATMKIGAVNIQSPEIRINSVASKDTISKNNVSKDDFSEDTFSKNNVSKDDFSKMDSFKINPPIAPKILKIPQNLQKENQTTTHFELKSFPNTEFKTSKIVNSDIHNNHEPVENKIEHYEHISRNETVEHTMPHETREMKAAGIKLFKIPKKHDEEYSLTNYQKNSKAKSSSTSAQTIIDSSNSDSLKIKKEQKRSSKKSDDSLLRNHEEKDTDTLKVSKENFQKLYDEALAFMKRKDYENASKLFFKALMVKPNHLASKIRLKECKEAMHHSGAIYHA